MSRFLARCSTTFGIILLLGFFFGNHTEYVANRSKPNIILGDSHASLLHLHTKSHGNLCQAADPLFCQYIKAKRYVETNRIVPDTLILVIGPHTFSQLADHRIFENGESWATANSPRIASLSSPQNYQDEIPHNLWIPVFAKELLTPSQITLESGWQSEQRMNGQPQSRVRRHFLDQEQWFHKNGINEIYLNKIVSFFVSTGTRIIILEAPRTLAYNNLINPIGYDEYCQFLTDFQIDNPQIQLLRDTCFHLQQDAFADADHLSILGSKRVAEFIFN